MISVGLAGLMTAWHGESFNVAIFLDTMNVKLCMLVLLIGLYPLIPLSVTLTVFQGHSNVEQSQLFSSDSVETFYNC